MVNTIISLRSVGAFLFEVCLTVVVDNKPRVVDLTRLAKQSFIPNGPAARLAECLFCGSDFLPYVEKRRAGHLFAEADLVDIRENEIGILFEDRDTACLDSVLVPVPDVDK